MNGTLVSRQVCGLSAVALLLAVPTWAAQTLSPAPESSTRPAVSTYEMVLRAAVVSGGQKLAQQASSAVPEAVLALTEQPIVRGIQLDWGSTGFFFDVQAPNVQTTVMVLDMVDAQARRSRPVSDGSGPADTEPRTRGLAGPGGADRAYSNFVREALIDAMLDGSAVLPLGPEDRLTIAASGIDQPGANLLYQSRKLILTIKGSDLLDLRQGRITRDQAKARIVEGRF